MRLRSGKSKNSESAFFDNKKKPMAEPFALIGISGLIFFFMTFFPLKPLLLSAVCLLAAAASAQQKENFQIRVSALDQTAKFPTTLL